MKCSLCGREEHGGTSVKGPKGWEVLCPDCQRLAAVWRAMWGSVAPANGAAPTLEAFDRHALACWEGCSCVPATLRVARRLDLVDSRVAGADCAEGGRLIAALSAVDGLRRQRTRSDELDAIAQRTSAKFAGVDLQPGEWFNHDGWLRSGPLVQCPRCRSVHEGTVGWSIAHRKSCGWMPRTLLEAAVCEKLGEAK